MIPSHFFLYGLPLISRWFYIVHPVASTRVPLLVSSESCSPHSCTQARPSSPVLRDFSVGAKQRQSRVLWSMVEYDYTITGHGRNHQLIKASNQFLIFGLDLDDE